MHRTLPAPRGSALAALLVAALVVGCGGNRDLGQPAPPPTTPPELTHALQATDEATPAQPASTGEASDPALAAEGTPAAPPPDAASTPDAAAPSDAAAPPPTP